MITMDTMITPCMEDRAVVVVPPNRTSDTPNEEVAVKTSIPANMYGPKKRNETTKSNKVLHGKIF